jgi:VanZ family protein
MQTQPSSHSKNPKIWRIALALYWLILLVGTHVPQKTPLLPKDRVDKFVHAVAFAALALLCAATWERTTARLKPRHLLWIWIAIALYAAVDEWTQTFVGRHASAQDWLADVIGAAFGLALFAWLGLGKADGQSAANGDQSA